MEHTNTNNLDTITKLRSDTRLLRRILAVLTVILAVAVVSDFASAVVI